MKIKHALEASVEKHSLTNENLIDFYIKRVIRVNGIRPQLLRPSFDKFQPSESARILLANVIVFDVFLNWNQKVLSAFSLTDW